MKRIHWLRPVLLLSGVGLIVFSTDSTPAQTYPNKPIRFISGESGGSSDFAVRLIAQGLTSSLGQPVIVENRGGAGGAIAGETVARAAPDGYTLLAYGPAFWLSPLMRKNVNYDPVRDFSPITAAVSTPNILVVHPALPVRSVKELRALAKARPGALNYGSGSTGASSHLAAELFNAMAGVHIVRITYKGGGPAMNDLIGGQIQVMFATASTTLPQVKSGRVRALAVTSAEPSILAPGLPTVAASGLPGYESVSTTGMFAPANTAPQIIKRLSDEILRVLGRADVKEKLLNAGAEPVGGSPEIFANTVKQEIARIGKLIKNANIKEE